MPQELIHKPFPGTQINRSYPLARGLVGCWLLNEQGQRCFDLSGHNNHGALNGFTSPTYSLGQRSTNGIKFDGVNDYVDAGNANSLNITNAITIEAWIRNNGSNSNIWYVSKVGDATHRVYGLGTVLGKPIMWLSPDGTQTNRWFRTSTIDLSTDLVNWHHIVSTYSAGSGTHIYVDGILTDGVITGTEGSSIGVTTSNLTIGSSTGAQYFNGMIDEVRIYNRALSANEVKQLYQNPYDIFMR